MQYSCEGLETWTLIVFGGTFAWEVPTFVIHRHQKVGEALAKTTGVVGSAAACRRGSLRLTLARVAESCHDDGCSIRSVTQVSPPGYDYDDVELRRGVLRLGTLKVAL